jgi:hypothetical protein
LLSLWWAADSWIIDTRKCHHTDWQALQQQQQQRRLFAKLQFCEHTRDHKHAGGRVCPARFQGAPNCWLITSMNKTISDQEESAQDCSRRRDIQRAYKKRVRSKTRSLLGEGLTFSGQRLVACFYPLAAGAAVCLLKVVTFALMMHDMHEQNNSGSWFPGKMGMPIQGQGEAQATLVALLIGACMRSFKIP